MSGPAPVTYLFADGLRRRRIPYGDEDRSATPSGTCHDCGASTGEVHAVGCDMEECPKCSGQALSCPCDTREMADKLGPETMARIQGMVGNGPGVDG